MIGIKGSETGITGYLRAPHKNRTISPGQLLVQLMLLGCTLVGLYGMLLGVTEVVPLNYNGVFLLTGYLLAGLVLIAVSLSGRFWKILVCGLLLGYAGLCIYNREELLAGVWEIGVKALDVFQSYGSGSVAATGVDVRDEVTLALLIVGLFFEIIMFFGITVIGGGMISLAMIVGLLALGMGANAMPGVLPFSLLICYGIAGFAGENIANAGIRIKTVLGVLGLSVLFILLSNVVLSPLIERQIGNTGEYRRSIQDTTLIQDMANRFHQWRGTRTTPGIGSGELGDGDGFTGGEEKVMDIYVDEAPISSLYLRCYIAREYTGQRWYDADDAEGVEDEFVRYHQLRERARGMGLNEQNIYMVKSPIAGDYEYKPYNALGGVAEDNIMSYTRFSDEVIEQLGGGYYFTDTQESYMNVIYGAYLSYPEEQLQRLEEEVAARPGNSIEGITAGIINFLHERAVYNLDTPSFPDDRDFAEYFIYDSGEGYCVHFATTATLMFRMYGIPARYVTGYMVPAAEFSAGDQGYEAVVKQSFAHAWVEIYYEGRGWVPVEVTPGTAGAGDSDEAETSQSDSAEPQPQSERRQQPQSEAGQQSGQQKKTGLTGGSLWWYLLTGVLVVLAALAVLQIRRTKILRDRRKARGEELFPVMVRLWELAGFPKDLDCEAPHFAGELAKRFPWLEADMITEMMKIVMKANFSFEQPQEEETLFMVRLYQYTCRNIYRDLNPWKRFLYRYFYVFA